MRDDYWDLPVEEYDRLIDSGEIEPTWTEADSDRLTSRLIALDGHVMPVGIDPEALRMIASRGMTMEQAAFRFGVTLNALRSASYRAGVRFERPRPGLSMQLYYKIMKTPERSGPEHKPVIRGSRR